MRRTWGLMVLGVVFGGAGTHEQEAMPDIELVK